MSYSLQEIPVYVLMGVTGQSLFLSLLVVFYLLLTGFHDNSTKFYFNKFILF